VTVIGHIGPASGDNQRPGVEVAPGFEEWGIEAFTTLRSRGSYALHAREEPAIDVFGRWLSLADELTALAPRLVFAHQVHGDTVLVHADAWHGWLRERDADAHVSLLPGTAMAVTVADCVPVFLAHPSGATAIIHSGWKGTLANVSAKAVRRLVEGGFPAQDMRAHCGPAICGACYEVSPDVYGQLTGRAVPGPTPVDLRALIVDELRSAGVSAISVSPSCTRCHTERFFSHRAGDEGRQLGVIVAAQR